MLGQIRVGEREGDGRDESGLENDVEGVGLPARGLRNSERTTEMGRRSH